MEQNADADCVGGFEGNRQPIGRIQHADLNVCEHRRAHEDVRCPKGDVSDAQGCIPRRPIWIKVDVGVAARNDAIGEGELMKAQQCEHDERENGNETAQGKS